MLTFGTPPANWRQIADSPYDYTCFEFRSDLQKKSALFANEVVSSWNRLQYGTNLVFIIQIKLDYFFVSSFRSG